MLIVSFEPDSAGLCIDVVASSSPLDRKMVESDLVFEQGTLVVFFMDS